MLIDQTRKGVRTAQRADVLHSIFLIPDEAASLGCIGRADLEWQAIKGLVVERERIGNSVQGKSRYLAPVIDRLRETRASSLRPQIADFSILPNYCTKFRQTGDDWIEFTIFGIAGDQSVRVDPKSRAARASRECAEVGLYTVLPLVCMGDIAVGDVAKEWIGGIGGRRRSVCKPYKNTPTVEDRGEAVENSAEAIIVGQVQIIKVTRRPPKRSNVN